MASTPLIQYEWDVGVEVISIRKDLQAFSFKKQPFTINVNSMRVSPFPTMAGVEGLQSARIERMRLTC